MHRIDTRFDLLRQIIDGGCSYGVNQFAKFHWVRIGKATRLCMVLAALSGDHIGCHGPGAACKAQKGGFGWQGGTDLANRFIYRIQALGRGYQFLPIIFGELGSQSRPFSGFEPQILPHGMRDDEDIRKQDRAIEAKTADRLQSDFTSGIAIIGQLEESALLRTKVTIFGKIATSLTHQPYWRHCRLFPSQGGEQFSYGQFGRHAGIQ